MATVSTNNEDDKLLYLITFRKSLNEIYVKYVFLGSQFLLENKDVEQTIKFNEGYKLDTNEQITGDFKDEIGINEQTADSYILLYTTDGSISHKSDLVNISNAGLNGKFEKVKLGSFISHDVIKDIGEAFKNASKIASNINEINKVIRIHNKNMKTDPITYKDIDSTKNRVINNNFKAIIEDYSRVYNELLNITYLRKFMSLDMNNLNNVKEGEQQQVVANLKSQFYDKNIKDLNTISENGINLNISKYQTNNQSAIEKGIYNNLSNDVYKETTDEIRKTKDFIRYLSKINKNIYNRNDERPESMKFIIEIINEHVEKMKDILNDKNNNILAQLYDKDDISKNYQHAINILIRNNMKNNILTFIKIRNDQTNTYNRRFDIHLNEEGKPKHLILKYNDDNLQYYKEDKAGNTIPNREIEEANIGKITSNNDIKINKYDREYILGEFTEIFEPKVKNREIAEKMDIVKNQLLADKPKPVFIMGYGASGAGKTSTLIYLKRTDKNGNVIEEKDGILIEICNQLRETYNRISIDHKEFYNSDCARDAGEGSTKNKCENKDTDSGNKKTYIETPVKNCNDGLNFTYIDEKTVKNDPNKFKNQKSGGFLLDNAYTHNIHHQFRVNKVEGEDESELGTEKQFEQYESLAKIIIYLIDTDRHVKATTNNPNSSRSHSLIFVNFKSSIDKNKNAYLIVGDFAGVENEFNCDNPSVLTDFQNIMGQDGNRFYENEQDKDGKLDPIGSNTSCENKNTTIQNGGGDSNEKVGELFDFENPDYNKIKNETGLNIRYQKPHEDMHIQFIRAMVDIYKDTPEYKIAPKESIEQYDTKYSDYKEQYDILEELCMYPSRYNNQSPSKNIEALFSYTKNVNTIEQLISYFKRIKNLKLLYVVGESGKLKPDSWRTPGKSMVLDKTLSETLDKHVNKVITKNYVDVFNELIMEQSTMGQSISFLAYFTKKVEGLTESFATTSSAGNARYGFDILTETYENAIKEYFNEDILKMYKEKSKNSSSSDRDMFKTTFDNLFDKTQPLLKLMNKIYGIKNVDKGTLYNQVKNKNSLTNNICKHQFIKLIFDNKKFFEFIKTEDEKRTKQLGLMEEVCTHRRTEGYFINDSLKNVRDIIRLALYEKNKDALNLLPNYVDICFDKYCPTHTNCFALNSNTNKIDSNKSIIFNNIYEYLKSKPGALDIEPETSNMTITEKEEYEKNTKLQMYKDLMICVFCVFNISYGANNPPPVPYVDINELKRIVYNYDIFKDKKQDFIDKSNELIETINSKFIQTYTDNTGKTQSKNLLEDLKKKSPEPKDHGLQTDKIIDSSYDLFKYLILHFEKYQINEGQHGGDERSDIVNFEKKLIKFIDLEISRIDLVVDHIENNNHMIGMNIKLWNNFYTNWTEYFKRDPIKQNNKKALYDNMRKEIMNEVDLIREGNDSKNLFNTVIQPTLKKEKINVFKPTSDRAKTEETRNDLVRIKTEKTDLQTLKESFINKHKMNQEYIKNAQEEVRRQQQQPKPQPEPQPEPEPQRIVLKDDISEANWGLINGIETRKKYIKYIHDFIEQVDTNNAISAVGTLEFMDKLSKLDMVATLCNDEGDTLIKEFDSKMGLRPLYEDDPSGGDSKRNTKRKRIPNNRTRKIRV